MKLLLSFFVLLIYVMFENDKKKLSLIAIFH